MDGSGASGGEGLAGGGKRGSVAGCSLLSSTYCVHCYRVCAVLKVAETGALAQFMHTAAVGYCA